MQNDTTKIDTNPLDKMLLHIANNHKHKLALSVLYAEKFLKLQIKGMKKEGNALQKFPCTR